MLPMFIMYLILTLLSKPKSFKLSVSYKVINELKVVLVGVDHIL